MTLPPLRLVERRRQVCTLAGDEVRFLLRQHRTHLELTPTERRQRWLVRPAGVAGVLTTPRRAIVIEPKMPLDNVLLLLDAATVGDDAPIATTAGGGLLDLLAGLLARRMRERASVGLHRGYREEATQGPYLVGRLDLAAQLRQSPAEAMRLHSRHDAFTADLPCNQLLRAVAAHLAGSLLLGETSRRALAEAVAGFAEVSETPLTPALLARARSEPAPAEYRPLLDLAALLAEALQPGLDVGPRHAPALLVSLERLFETYLTRLVTTAFTDRPGQRVAVQVTHHPALPSPGAPDLTIRPDLTIDREERPCVVLDAKWKRLGAAPPAADVYQVVAYATLLGAERAVLVYPGGGRRRWDLTFTDCPVRLQVRTLAVAGSAQRCQLAARRLQRDLRALAAASGADG